MKNEFINKAHVEGYIFDHTLQKRTSSKGVEYIGGILNVATDSEAMNVVPVHFIYVTEVYSKSGKTNPNFGILDKIIEDGNTYSVNGNEAQKVRIDGNLGVNDFVTKDGEMVAAQRIVGNFIHTMNNTDPIADKAATFEADMLITSCVEKEIADSDRYDQIEGYAFGYQGRLVPITLSVRSEGGMKYFEDQDISKANPFCTKVWGDVVSNTITKETTVESAFGAPQVNITSRTFRSWDVEGCSAEPYMWDDESFITKDELKQALANREEQLAEVRKRNDEYRNSQAGKSGFPTESTTKKTSAPAEDEFPF